jgi:hypothetical protein
MTSEELAEIEQRVNAASKGPWKTEYEWNGNPVVINDETEICDVFNEHDAVFILAARADVLALIAEVHALTEFADATLAVRTTHRTLTAAREYQVAIATAAVFDKAERRLDALLEAYEREKREATG